MHGPCRYFDYVSFNAGGTRGVAPVVLGVLLSTVKKVIIPPPLM